MSKNKIPDDAKTPEEKASAGQSLSQEERAAAEANADPQAVANAMRDKSRSEAAERSRAEAEQAERDANEPSGAGRVKVRQGQFIQMQGAHWFRCTDVNVRLNRDLSAIGVALEDFEYDAKVGAENRTIKNFTLRQFYKDPLRPQKAYTLFRRGPNGELGIEEFLDDLCTRGKPEIAEAIGPVIKAAVAEFEKQYREPVLA